MLGCLLFLAECDWVWFAVLNDVPKTSQSVTVFKDVVLSLSLVRYSKGW